MAKCEIRKLMLKYMRYLDELKELHVFDNEEKARKKRDIAILKQKIRLLKEKLEE